MVQVTPSSAMRRPAPTASQTSSTSRCWQMALDPTESRSERAFIQRAEAIGLRYNAPVRIEGYNISQGRAISIAIFRSEGTE